MRIKQLWCRRSRLLRVKNAMECYASLGFDVWEVPAIRCAWSWRCSHHCEHFSHYIPPTSLVLTIDFTLIQSQWMKQKEGELKQTWAHVARIENSSCEPGKKKMRWEKVAGKSSIWPIDSARRQKWNIFFFSPLFVYYLRGAVFYCFPFFACFHVIFNFSHFSFFLRHRSQLKRFFLLLHRISSRETFFSPLRQ